MRNEDFLQLAQFFKVRAGLKIGIDKKYLIETRLIPVLYKYGQKDIMSLIELMEHDPREAEIKYDIIEAMVTHETLFFRDHRPFEQFRRILLPCLLAHRQDTRKIRIWSAACSSGQEPYSLAMILREEARLLKGWDIKIIATDISRKMLDRAQKGLYSNFETGRGLSQELRSKYFIQKENQWQIHQDLRDMVHYREFNLLDRAEFPERFDLIFCRNVLIYFDKRTKSAVLENLVKVLCNGGMICLGGSETIIGITDRLQTVPGCKGLYQVAHQNYGLSTKVSALVSVSSVNNHP